MCRWLTSFDRSRVPLHQFLISYSRESERSAEDSNDLNEALSHLKNTLPLLIVNTIRQTKQLNSGETLPQIPELLISTLIVYSICHDEVLGGHFKPLGIELYP